MCRHQFISNLGEGHELIGSFGEEVPYYWLFDGGGVISLGKFGWRLVEFFHITTMLKAVCLLFVITLICRSRYIQKNVSIQYICLKVSS